MFCRKCGNELADDAKFCSKCGQIIEGTVENQNEVVLDDRQQKQKEGLSGQILKYGILSLVFASTFIVAFLGIVFATKAKNAAEYFEHKYNSLDVRARVGKILSIPGLILSIVMTVIFVLYLLIFVIALSQAQ